MCARFLKGPNPAAWRRTEESCCAVQNTGPDCGEGDPSAIFLLNVLGGVEGGHQIGFMVLHNSDDLPRIDGRIRIADPGQGIVDLDRAAVRRERHNRNIRYLSQPHRVVVVDFDDYPFRMFQEGGGGTDGGAQENAAVRRDLGRFDNRKV